MKKIIDKITKAENIALFCHINCDSDAVGSVLAMNEVLKGMGKKVSVFIDDKIPERLLFLADMTGIQYYTEFKNDNFDLYCSLDCGDLDRLGTYKEIFKSAENCISIDHHISNTYFADENYVDADASSTGEILVELFEKMNVKINDKTATLLYASIASDTGCFQYSNTSSKTHLYTAHLMELNADTVTINKKLFDTYMPNEIKLKGYAMNNIEFFKNGQIAVVTVTKEVLDRFNCSYEEAEGLSGFPRSVFGVEIGLLVKEWTDNKVKISIRTNEVADASELASNFGGGGHVRASGCVIEGSVENAKAKIIVAAEKLLKG